MSSTLNAIATFLAKPIPLGLMLVFFFVSLAVFSLFLGRVESRNREVQLRYQEQIFALTQQRGQSWAGAYDPMRASSSGGGWLGWITVLALVICGGVVVNASQRSPSSELVVPEIAGMGAKTPEFTSVKPGPALVQASSVAPAAPAATPKPVPEPVTAPAPVVQKDLAKAVVTPEPLAKPQLKPAVKASPQGSQSPDQDIERMLARERKRAARRRQARRGGSSSDAWVPERPRNRRSPSSSVSRQRSSQSSSVDSRTTSESAKRNKRSDELLPATSLPKKRRRRLKLDRSNDPLGSL